MSDAERTSGVQLEPQERARRLRKRHFAQAVVTGLGGFALALVFGFLLLIGRDLRMPDWLQARIEARIATALPGVNIGLGSMVFRIERADLSPRVFFQNVTVKDETGLPFASLGELSVRASFPAALQGEFLPKKISLSGALVKLRRASDGSFDLTIGSSLETTGEAATLVGLIEGLDQILVLPELRYLRDVDADSLAVLYEDARAGRAWTVDGGRVRVTRRGANLALGADFALLGGQDYATTLELSYDSAIGSPAARIGLTLADAPSQDIASQSEALAWMEALRAPISGSLRTEVNDEGDLGPLNATLQIGEGVVQPEREARPVPFDGAQAYFTYQPDGNILEFNELTVKSAWGQARMEGRARLQNAPGGWPEALQGQFTLSNILANPDDLYEVPVALERADLDMRLTFDPFQLDIGQLALRQNGETLVASARADIDAQGWRVGVDARAKSLALDGVLAVWPDNFKPKTRNWIDQNIQKGKIHDARLAFRSAEGERGRVDLTFGYSEASLRFMKTLPPIEEGRGYVNIAGKRFLASAEAGYVTALQGGRVDVAGTSFEIPDLSIKGPAANIFLATKSTVTAALSLLDQKPFEFLSKAGQPVALADGQARLNGTIGIALKQKIPASEIAFDVAGVITGVRSETLVEGRVLGADRLDLRAKSDGITLAGRGRIDAVPFEGTWVMPLGKKGQGSELNGEIELSERFIDTFNIGLPPGAVSGKGSGNITLVLKPDTPPSFALSSSLAGVALRLSALGWRKGATSKGSLSVRGTLGGKQYGPPRIDRLALDAAGLKVSGDIIISSNGTLDQARFERVEAGNWLNAPITLTGRGKNVSPAVTLRGGTLDLRKIPDQDTSGAAARVPLNVTLDRLQVSKDIVLTNFQGAFVSDRGLTGDFKASLNGAVPISGATLPRSGRTSVQIKSANAGRVLSAAGLLKSADEGQLVLNLVPQGRAGQYDGSLEISNLRLRDAPPALGLLSAASGIGLLEQMDGRGLMFSEVSSSFRISPETIIVSKGSAVGPSLGLSVDGYYDVIGKRMDMQGVVSPFFAINGIGSILTRKGEGLIGFNYTLQGSAASPQVRVNPLSLFTPGMFREIFRRPPPQLSQ